MRRRMFVAVVLMMGVFAVARSAAPQSAFANDLVWSGSVRCEIEMQGTGYSNHETHTWTITGPPSPGDVPEYPGTWTVTGEGFAQPTDRRKGTVWKTSGSAPGVRMAIFVRGQDRRWLVLLRQAQLSIADTTPISEWRPFPEIQDAETASRLTGSTTTPLSRTTALQPSDAKGQARCTWDLSR